MGHGPRLARRLAQPDEHSARLILRSAAAKPDALAIIALAVDSHVEGAGTLEPRVPIADGAWVEVQLPTEGEPPPLAIDVYSAVGDEHARLTALTLLARLEAATAWNLRPDFAY